MCNVAVDGGKLEFVVVSRGSQQHFRVCGRETVFWEVVGEDDECGRRRRRRRRRRRVVRIREPATAGATVCPRLEILSSLWRACCGRGSPRR
jgi:hypothetical protein